MAKSIYSVEFASGKTPIAGGFPDVSGHTWEALQTDRAFAGVMAGEDFLIDNADVTGPDPFSFTAPEVVDPTNKTGGVVFGAADGEPVRRMRVPTIGLVMRAYAPEVGKSFSDVPLHRALETCNAYIDPPVPTTAVVAAGAHNGEFDVGVGEGVNFPIGTGVEFVKNSLIYYAVVTDVTADTVTVSPEFPTAVSPADVLRHCRTYAPRRGVCPDVNLLSFRFAADGIEHVGFDSVCTGVQIVIDDSGAVKIGVTIRPNSEVCVRTGGGTVATYTPTTVRQMTKLQSCNRKTVASIKGATSPGHAVAPGADMTDITISIEYTGRAGSACGTNIITEEPYEFSRTESTLEYTTQDVGAYTKTMLDGEAHQLVWGGGPPGQGMAVIFMSNHLRSTEVVGESDSNVETIAVSWRNGAWGGDTPTANNIAGTDLRLLFPMPDP